MNIPKFRYARKTHIGSTVACSFVDRDPPARKAYYAVVATDRLDNHFE
jgi:hypothetical protein